MNLFTNLFNEITRCCQENFSSKGFHTLAPNENLTNTTSTHNVRRGRTLDVFVLSLAESVRNWRLNLRLRLFQKQSGRAGALEQFVLKTLLLLLSSIITETSHTLASFSYTYAISIAKIKFCFRFFKFIEFSITTILRFHGLFLSFFAHLQKKKILQNLKKMSQNTKNKKNSNSNIATS